MAEYPALPIQVNSYLADTGWMTRAERGDYVMLLIHLWRSSGCCIRAGLPLFLNGYLDETADGLVPGHYAKVHILWERHPSRLLHSEWRKTRQAFLDANQGVCAYCGTTEAEVWHVDHKISRADGGTNTWNNLAVACAPCNWRKGRKSVED